MPPPNYQHDTLPNPTRQELLSILQMMLPVFGGTSIQANAVYPHDIHDLSSPQYERLADRLHGLCTADRSIVWCRVRDLACGGRVVGAAQWCFYDGDGIGEGGDGSVEERVEEATARLFDGPETADDTWESAGEKAWARAVYGVFIRSRCEVLRREARPVVGELAFVAVVAVSQGRPTTVCLSVCLSVYCNLRCWATAC
ncbi:hypothetical protein EJ05DRAFT_130852 [Pseudovirgaria hyperparasitica]|uniref:Uncharacterized protein n=1 Tax=Pseudovirgaria hyperparasitica TaxID=470096 RepID=A0A6A6W0W0_9PEZI|nr:uncharacterized protein EJ05DRAFT_130852 [Pseudovirgaria hyperparasitica]KAF2754711.1 hypothetical protein EJ05DRAFT_130852 [Pseudovirgaria hyperparasitica]